MNTQLIDGIAAIRMAASAESLKAAAFVPLSDDNNDIKSKASLKASVSNLVNCAKQYKDQLKEVEIFEAEGEGFIIIAESQASIDNLLSASEAPSPAPAGRVKNKVFIVTGGAQGFGAGIAKEIFAEGGNVVIADLNADKGEKIAAALNEKKQANKAAFVSTNVSDPDSVKNLVQQTVLKFGGLDVLVSNAGILRAGGLDEMTPETFKLMTEINYAGYFYCSKYASQIMKVQTSVNAGFFCDILQINSKSGLAGSKKNFAYAGGKFGGIGLTQSFALELMGHQIKVNSICPGNFFEGPLWADPENGLFVQYLKAGKVAGAKTIEDVKKHYEKQVPAGRGCRVIDVARAIFYAIEQEYETGQAIPVTGGQIMLK